MEDKALALAQQIAARLGTIEGVEAVALGGSRARGAAKFNSDIDLAIYYDPAQPPALGELQALAQEFDDEHRHDVLTDFGGWGRWIDGGGWLKINGGPVDWLYRNLAVVRDTLEDCWAGHISTDLNPGHPHGFHNYIYLGETHFCRPLYDPSGRLATLKVQAQNYPPLLKQAIIQNNLWQSDFALQISRKSVARGESFYVAGCLFRCAACLTQVIFALNEQFFLNEKGALSLTDTFPLCPPNFNASISEVMARLGSTSDQLQASLRRFEQLIEQIRFLSTHS